jgi:hypothetical protein
LSIGDLADKPAVERSGGWRLGRLLDRGANAGQLDPGVDYSDDGAAGLSASLSWAA